MIVASALTKSFGGHVAVREMSFTAPVGKVTGFLGPNGAGKTTTFRILLGLARPTAGTVTIAGRPYDQLHRPRERVGAVLESSGFHPSRTARNHLRVVATSAGLPATRIGEVLSLVGLGGVADKAVGEFSMGMRQRLALANAMLGDPEVLVLDEPANGLDPQGVAWLRGLLRGWAAEGRTVLVSSHLLAEVAQVVDHVVIISNGQVRHEGPANQAIETTTTLQIITPEPDRLAAVLRGEGAMASLRDGTVIATGVAAHEVGRIAATHDLTIRDVAEQRGDHSLEQLFLSLTGTEQAVA